MSSTINRVLLAVAAVSASLSGCQSLQTIQVRDDNARTFSGTIIARPEEMKYGSGRAGRGGVEFAYERYRGTSGQDIDKDHYLGLDQGTIHGPQSSTNTADIHHGHIAYNHLFSFGSHFQVEPAIGVAYDRYEATAIGSAPGSRELTVDGHKWGALISLTPRFNFNPYFGIEVRGMASGDFHGTQIGGTNPAFVISPNQHVMFKVGYYWRNDEFDTPSARSNVEPKFSGFSGNLTLIF